MPLLRPGMALAMKTDTLDASENPLGLGERFRMLNWGFVAVVAAIGGTGVALLYSAGGMAWEPWAGRHLSRFGTIFVLMIAVALIDVRVWLRIAYWAYAAMLVLLVVVEVMGHVGMGAQRWISVGGLVVQPSELMKIALVLALARYFHALTYEQTGKVLSLVPPILLVAAPVGLVLMQPNLGTALLLILGSGALFWVAGVRMWTFAVAGVAGAGAAVVGWQFLHDYQKRRVYTFLDPETDPLGAGYNIAQSKIALGAGGLLGKGFGNGSQSQLSFLPEKHTDFIFVVLAEEFGFAGSMLLFTLYLVLIGYGYLIGLTARNHFGRLVALGLTTTFFLYFLVNVAMVSGLMPVVGIPLPPVSYGGTAMLTFLAGCGVLLSISIHRNVRIGRHGTA